MTIHYISIFSLSFFSFDWHVISRQSGHGSYPAARTTCEPWILLSLLDVRSSKWGYSYLSTPCSFIWKNRSLNGSCVIISFEKRRNRVAYDRWWKLKLSLMKKIYKKYFDRRIWNFLFLEKLFLNFSLFL